MGNTDLSTIELWQEAIWAARVPLAIWFAVALVVAAMIARKAGYSAWLGVVIVGVPVGGLLVALAVATIRWPALKERDQAVALLEKHAPEEVPKVEAEAKKKPTKADAKKKPTKRGKKRQKDTPPSSDDDK